MKYYIVHKDSPRDALRVCKNMRYAQMIIMSINNPDYIITIGPIDKIVNRVVSIVS